MSEDTIEVKKKKKWLVPVIIGAGAAVLVAIAAIVIAVVVSAGAPKRALQKQLDLGKMYMTELDYDSAIPAYEEALKIDPKNVEAYLGLGEAYLKAAGEKQASDDYEAAGAYLDKGIGVLQTGVYETGDSQIEEKLEDLKKKQSENEELLQKHLEELKAEEEKKLKEAEYQAYEQVETGVLVDIAKALSEDHMYQAIDYMFGEEYASIIEEMKRNGEESRIVNTPYGPIQVAHRPQSGYVELGDYFVYSGDFKDGLREGSGIWLEADLNYSKDPVYVGYKCSFINDVPEGAFEQYHDDSNGDMELFKKGNVKAGLFEGRIQEPYIENGFESEGFMYENGRMVNFIIEKSDAVYFDENGRELPMYEIYDKDNPDIRTSCPQEGISYYQNTPLEGIFGFYVFEDYTRMY